jgi:hypothetical protein
MPVKNSIMRVENFTCFLIPAIILIGFLFSTPAQASDLESHILDYFPFAVNNNYNSFNGINAGFSNLRLQADNPFGSKYDRSLFAENNVGSYSTLSTEIGPLPNNGFSVSWWYRWNAYSGTGNIEVLDNDQNLLLGAYLGVDDNIIYFPTGSDGINWSEYNITSAEMGDGAWHQFMLTSNGSDIKLYFDGQEKASGAFNQSINYASKGIKHIYLSGSGDKSFDEIIFWDKYLTADEAAEIYNHGSFYNYPSESSVVNLTKSQIQNSIIDAFPFNSQYAFNSIKGLNNGFSWLGGTNDNPFSIPNDWSIETDNNQGANLYSQMSEDTQPISGSGFSTSWWFKWTNYSGSLKVDVRDQNNNSLFSGYWGQLKMKCFRRMVAVEYFGKSIILAPK